MKQIKHLFAGICVSAVVLFAAANGFSQVTVEPSYEVSLQMLMGSNEPTAKAGLPTSLSAVSQHLKTKFNYSSYTLAGTILGRMSNTGEFTYKGVSNIGVEEKGNLAQSFLEWTIGPLRSGPTVKGANGFQIHAVRFGARIPVPVSTRKDESGKEHIISNYEQIGLSLSRLGIQENMPTLIGTLEMPGAAETIFLVMTVKSIDL